MRESLRAYFNQVCVKLNLERGGGGLRLDFEKAYFSRKTWTILKKVSHLGEKKKKTSFQLSLTVNFPII